MTCREFEETFNVKVPLVCQQLFAGPLKGLAYPYRPAAKAWVSSRQMAAHRQLGRTRR